MGGYSLGRLRKPARVTREGVRAVILRNRDGQYWAWSRWGVTGAFGCDSSSRGPAI
jgi:hypothetical protein